MSTEEQATAPSGSVPLAYGNALAWKWSREMPTPLRRGFLTLLYALRAMANASGELRFHSDRQPIRIQDIARAAGASEKDARRYLDAAIRAGVVVVKGERKRGKPTLYVILPTPWPDWKAAEDHLKSTARKPGKRPAPWSKEAGSSGHRDPNNPGSTQGLSQDAAEVGSQPQPLEPPESQDHDSQDEQTPDNDTSGWITCARCHDPMLPRYGRTTHAHCQPLAEPERTAS